MTRRGLGKMFLMVGGGIALLAALPLLGSRAPFPGRLPGDIVARLWR